SDAATLAGGSGTLSGTITFTLYGPNDATCGSAAIFTNTKAVVSSGGGTGTATSNPFTPSQAGTYRWRASYSGDTNNAGTATACNDPGEPSVVTQATPLLTTAAPPPSTPLFRSSDAATLAGGSGTLSGTITFTLYGPNDATCGNAAIFTNTKAVVSSGGGTGTATSNPFTPSQAGTYRWRASYSGDTNNAATATACNDSGEPSVVNEVAQTPGKVTGGGVIDVTGGTANFGFVAQRKTTGGPASGNLNYLDHATKRHVHGPVTSLT